MLTERRSTLLNLIVQDYVETAVPIGSEYIVRKHQLPYSSATIRNEMARLEEAGFITQPHTSAGRVPSDRGYRYYVEALMSEEQLGSQERETIRHQFHQAERDLEQWFQLAAAVLAHHLRNFAVVTAPRSRETRLKHVQLVSLQDFSALLVVVLQEARIRQQVIGHREPMDQAQLTVVAGRINERYGGLDVADIRAKPPPASEFEEQVLEAVIDLMEQESLALGEVYRDGVREVLSQPEFARSDRMLDLVDALEERTLVSAIPIRQLQDEGISVLIGSENSLETMRDCSIVFARYGSESGASGVVAVIGPTRMRYARTIPTVRYLAAVLGELVTQI
ncbi:MAG TPA: heat-inducible transcriptional repressor HrcA [Dehalococcoidia bacterium]|jgi:heat-inducible transcriptional repressor|nr:heat-inducible transcriptional repressor HrcA [Dehalococcoidia bacterium]